MYRQRHRFQQIIVFLCLTIGGYQVTSAALAQSADPNASTALISTEIDKEYDGLPAGVAQAVQSVVATVKLAETNGKTGAVASGVILNDGEVLTAAHNVTNGKQLQCAHLIVAAPGMLSGATASSESVTFASAEYDGSSDLALVTVDGSDNFRQLPDIRIAQRLPEKGDRVYFINFQPTADGKARNPQLQPSADKRTDYSKPAIFAGTVLGDHDDGVAVATGYGKSYGIGAPDSMIRKGASGGAVVNDRGELVGLSVSSQSLAADRTADSVSAMYGVKLQGGPFQIVNMQPVAQAKIAKLRSTLVPCANH